MAEVESQERQQPPNTVVKDDQNSKGLHRLLLALNIIGMVAGACTSPLLLRLYFVRGGRRKWLSTWIQSAGWPIIFIPIAICYHIRRRANSALKVKTRPFLMNTPIFLACSALGILNGVDGFLYTAGMSYLPVSTSSLLVSSQLGFTALFAYLLVRQKFTPFSINAVVLLTVGAVLLGVNSSGDRPEGESRGQYYVGFFMALAAAALYGLMLPLVEATYAKAEQGITYALVMEMQLLICLVATAFCTVGMIVNRDFQVIAREAKAFELGEAKYYVVLATSTITWQLFSLGTLGAIFCASAMLAGIITVSLIPVTEVLAVIFFNESFTGNKGIALVLSLWGFASYFYGEYKEKNSKKDHISTNPN